MRNYIFRLTKKAKLGGIQNWIILCITVFVVAFVAYRADQVSNDSYVQLVKSDTRIRFLDLRQTTVEAIYSKFLILKELSTFIGDNPDLTQANYAKRARRIMGSDRSVVSIAAARDLTVSLVYPLTTNRNILGFSYRNSNNEFPVVQQMLRDGRETMVAPVTLTQGGSGIILRAPVYISDIGNEKRASEPWGIVGIVLDYNRFIEETGVLDLASSYDILISSTDASGEFNQTLFGNADIKNMDPIILDFVFPSGSWKVYAVQKGGWPQHAPNLWRDRIIMAFMAAIVIGIMIFILRLAESRRRAKNFLVNGIEAMDDGFVMYDADDRLILSNQKYRDLYNFSDCLMRPGTPFAEILKSGVFREEYLHDPEGQQKIINRRLDARRAGKAMNFEQHLLNGRVIHASDRRMSDGSYVGVRVDVSELMHAKEAAETANRAKTDFMGVLSHELRTPLTVMLGVAKLSNNVHLLKPAKVLLAAVDAGDRSPAEIRLLIDKLFQHLTGLMARMVNSGDHLLHLINEVLDYAKSESGSLSVVSERCEIQDITRPVVEQLRTLSDAKGLAFKTSIAAGTLWADKARTGQILYNLLGNAIKFTASGSVQLIVTITQTEVVFDVHDTGDGISETEFEDIFQAFYQVDSTATRHAGGTGMGLAISRNLAELQGGTLTVSSVVGEGSCFRLMLPRVSDPAIPVNS